MKNQSATLVNKLMLLSALAMLIIAVVMLFIFPSKADLPEGFSTPIIAFEFAQSEVDITYLTDPAKNAEENRHKMFTGLKWDMAFPFAYGGFVFLLILQIALAQPAKKLPWAGLLPALLIVPFDLLENVQMLAILKAIESAALSAELFSNLFLATWLKWGAIGVALGILAIAFWQVGRRKSALVAAVPALATVVCFFSSTNPQAAEVMAATVGISLFILAVVEFRVYYRND